MDVHRGNYTLVPDPKDPSRTLFTSNRTIVPVNESMGDLALQILEKAWPLQAAGLHAWAANLSCNVRGNVEYLYLIKLKADAPAFTSATPALKLLEYLAGALSPPLSWHSRM